MKAIMKPVIYSSAQLITIIFTIIILAGTIALKLPISSNYNQQLSWIDALFVATSATCVTGLSPIAINEQFNGFGQSVILLLIEIGGIGFMSIPILFYVVRRKKINLSTRILLRETMNTESKSGEFSLALSILKISFLIQSLGIVCLAFNFIPRYGVKSGLWYSVFHSVSAFCNAGFDLFGNSLENFRNNPSVLLTICMLIISGGLGFIVWVDLLQCRKKKLSLHSKLALSVTSFLLVIGFIFFMSSTGKNQDSLFNNIIHAFFMSTTPRTAGFFTINYNDMKQSGLMMTMILMFIGGTSGSTAGGLKTTTLAVLFLKVHSTFKGKQRVEIFNRSIKELTVSKALTLFFLSLFICTASVFILTITEDLDLVQLMFEVISAFGTVGLSTGITPELTVGGKLVIICLMFIGRIGIMTILFSLYGKSNKQTLKIKYPEEVIMLG